MSEQKLPISQMQTRDMGMSQIRAIWAPDRKGLLSIPAFIHAFSSQGPSLSIQTHVESHTKYGEHSISVHLSWLNWHNKWCKIRFFITQKIPSHFQ